jgi:CBS domain-containing protein
MTCVVDSRRSALGIITDGDLRRQMMVAQKATADRFAS